LLVLSIIDESCLSKLTKYQKEFFEKQPLLFEPNNVFRFDLIEYQEKLKKIYQTMKRDSQTGITIDYYL